MRVCAGVCLYVNEWFCRHSLEKLRLDVVNPVLIRTGDEVFVNAHHQLQYQGWESV